MLKHNEYQQGSLEWLTARAGRPTASEFSALVSPKWEMRKGQMPLTLLASKVAEAWIGGALPGFGSWSTEQGTILQDEAIPRLALELDKEIESVGFITTDDGRVGCSPDGLIGEMGIEVKCPEPTNHVKYLLDGKVPDDFLAQIHGGMYVTGFSRWLFYAYRRHFPPLLLTVERDEKIQAVLAETLAGFLAQFDKAYARLVELNGGPPKRTPIPQQPLPADIRGNYERRDFPKPL